MATPMWCDMEELQDLRLQAKAISTATGVKHNLDHIVPLRGELVCGLNIPANIQIIPERINTLKGNTYDPTADTPAPELQAMLDGQHDGIVDGSIPWENLRANKRRARKRKNKRLKRCRNTRRQRKAR